MIATLNTPGPDAAPRDAEREGFLALRVRRRWFWTTSLGGLPITWGAALVHERVGFVVATCWVVAFGVASAIHGWSKCPRCGDPCFQTGWRNPLALRCHSCGTRLYWSDGELGMPKEHNLGAHEAAEQGDEADKA